MISTMFPGCEVIPVLMTITVFALGVLGLAALLTVLAILIDEWRDDGEADDR